MSVGKDIPDADAELYFNDIGISHRPHIIDGTGAIPRLFTAWIRAVILWFPTGFFTTAYMRVSAYQL